jgi:hypothetical protein
MEKMKMSNETQGSPKFLDSAEVTRVLGIPSILLNKFVERKSYGIHPSIRSGEGRGSRRLFSEADVHGLAMVWWLFEAGLRSESIQQVLNDICGAERKGIANLSAEILLRGAFEILVIRREPRTASDLRRSYPKQKTLLVDWQAANHLMEEARTASMLFIPIKARFSELKVAMAKLGAAVEKD